MPGKLVDTKALYLVHMVSCEGAVPTGRARRVFSKFPYASPYRGNTTTRAPGTMSVHGDGASRRFVVNLYARLRDGAARAAGQDTRWKRDHYFQGALDALYAHICAIHTHRVSLAFPWGMGCGNDGGGDWLDHIDVINRFARKLHAVDGMHASVVVSKPRSISGAQYAGSASAVKRQRDSFYTRSRARRTGAFSCQRYTAYGQSHGWPCYASSSDKDGDESDTLHEAPTLVRSDTGLRGSAVGSSATDCSSCSASVRYASEATPHPRLPQASRACVTRAGRRQFSRLDGVSSSAASAATKQR